MSGHGEAVGRRLDVCLIGAQKAGSTSLARWMADHPGICHSRIKETHFWAEDHTDAEVAAWFDDQFAAARPGQLLVDSSTSYSMHPEFSGVPERLHRHNPDMRFLYLLRDPVRRAESHLVHSYRNGVIDRADLDALQADPTFLERSSYHLQLERYLTCFAAEQLHVVVFEELVADPAARLAEVEAFLGLTGGSGELPRANVSAVRPGVTGVELALRRAGIRMPHRLRQALRRRWGRRSPEQVLDERERAIVRAELADDRDALERFLGRELPWPRS